MTTRALVEAALVGTARQPDRAVAALDGQLPVDELVARMGDALPIERRVLLAAAAHDAYARAGRAATSGATVVTPAPTETRPPCTATAAALIGELIMLRPRLLLREALERLDESNAIVTPSLLPELLDTRDELLATVVPRVIGERGRWLATLTGDGEWLVSDAPDDEEARRLWNEGPHARRVTVLRARRRIDPADARTWLAESWASESAEHRAQLLATLDEKLSADDALFLEEALNDRSVLVRTAAARLLMRIPDSEAARRFAARADAMLDHEPPTRTSGVRARLAKAIGLGETSTLVVHPPDAYDASWERDGITAKPPKGVGERAFWLVQALALVRPAHWVERFRVPPPELIRAAHATDWSLALLQGWSLATLLSGDETWTTALFDAWRELKIDDETAPHAITTRGTMLMQLHRRLPTPEAEQRVLDLMSRPVSELPFGLGVLVEAAPRPWTAAFGARFVERLGGLLTTAASATQWTPGTWFESLTQVALVLPPESFTDALHLERRLGEIDTLPPAYRRKLDELRDTIRLRHRIHQEIRVEPAHR